MTLQVCSNKKLVIAHDKHQNMHENRFNIWNESVNIYDYEYVLYINFMITKLSGDNN